MHPRAPHPSLTALTHTHIHTAAAGQGPSSPRHHLYHPQLCFLDNSLEGLIWTVYIVMQLILSFKAKMLQLLYHLCQYLLFYILETIQKSALAMLYGI